MKKIRVLHIIDKLEAGGAQTLIRDIISSESLANFEFFICTLRNSQNEVEINSKNIIRLRKNKYNLFCFLDIFRIAKKYEIDIMHLHLDKSIMMGIIAAFFGSWKVIIHQHSMIFATNYRTFLRIFRNYVDAFVAISNTIREELVYKTNVPSNKIRIINNCINLDKFRIAEDRPLIKSNFGIQPRDIILGFVGRLVKQKGCEILLRAIKNIPKMSDNIVLLVIGDGKLRPFLMKMGRNLGSKKRSIFLGFQEDLTKFLSIFDIAIIPSIYEPFGTIALEYMAMRVPIISSNVDGLSEFIQDKRNGILFKKGSINDLKNAIQVMISDEKLRNSLALNGYKTVKNFDTNKILPYYKELYYGILSQ
jgi:glycosyltransferase involved in cell wall biosynthesis